MCGIVGVTGSSPALPVLLEGLSRLDYRGYDSCGVALVDHGSLWLRRRSGKLAVLRDAVGDAPVASVTGIGHTRWATHGSPTEANAHPHADCTGRLAIVHNGIFENHRQLRAKLEANGHQFRSDTDSEVMAHLIEDRTASGSSVTAAIEAAARDVRGSFALAVVDADDPLTLTVSRQGSPVVVGRTGASALVASDVTALAAYTEDLSTLDDGQIVELRPAEVHVARGTRRTLRPERRTGGWDASPVERDGHPHFMLKEIHEQPRAIAATVGGRRQVDSPQAADAVGLSPEQTANLRRIVVVGCGTSLHAGMAARPALEAWARLPVECDIASEFRYRDLVLDHSTLVVGVSQSGETIDTLYALRQARAHNAPVVVVTNVASSAMAREADAVLLTHAGPEIGVAATKTHVAQIVCLQKLALTLSDARSTLAPGRRAQLLEALGRLPEEVESVLARSDETCSLARRFTDVRDFFFLGRGTGYATALEGALKLKEVSYVRAEAYSAGEMKHGPIALIEPGVVVVAVLGTGPLREKMLSNVAEVRARGATVVVVAAEGDVEAADAADHLLPVPRPVPGAELLSPVVEVVPLQLLAYALATAKGFDVDKPRNLAKTVTVE
jgi:glucosamine--fructose-6-phosphate aminotransferase (isomerizing)